MLRPLLVIKPSSLTTRLLLSSLDGEMLRAQLPPPAMAHPRAASTLLEGLSLWLGQPLSVVLCAGARDASSALHLSDGLGLGASTLHYDLEVVDLARRGRGLGRFADLRRQIFRGLP